MTCRMIDAVNHAKNARMSALFVAKVALSLMLPVALAAPIASCSSAEPSRSVPGNVGRPKDSVACCPCEDSSEPDVYQPDVHDNDAQQNDPVATLVTVSFGTPFVLAGANWQNDDYLTQHQDGLLNGAAFVGSYLADGAKVPPEESTTVSVAIRNLSGFLEASVPLGVLQRSFHESQVLPPLVLMTLQPELVATGVMQVTPEANGPVRVMLLETTGGSSYCVSAVGIGEINVTEAENLQAEDGGKLAFTGENIVMYHPMKTPNGDMSTQVGSAICVE